MKGRRTAIIAFGLVLAVLLVRLAFALNHKGYWGVDGGAYLINMYALLGEPQLTDFPRPPLAPGWLLVPFVWLWGADAGLKLFHVAATIPIIPAFWLLVRLWLPPKQALMALALMLTNWMLAEMFTAGALPMLGFSLILLVLWAMVRLSRSPDRLAQAAIALSIPGIAFVNQTSTGIAAFVFTSLFVALALRLRKAGDLKTFLTRIMPAVVLGFLLALTAIPWYLSVVPGSEYTRYNGPLIAFYSPQNATWFQLTLAIAGIALLLRWATDDLRALIAPLAILGAMLPFISYDESIMNIMYRSRYLIEVLMCLVVSWAFFQIWERSKAWNLRPLVTWSAAVMGAFLVIGFFVQLHSETRLGQMVRPPTMEALTWLDDQQVSGSVVTNSYSLSLYVSGLLHNRTAWAQVYDPPKAYAQQQADVVCLFGWKDCDVEDAIERLDAQYVLVDRVWPSFGKDIQKALPDLGWSYAFIDFLAPWDDSHLGRIWESPCEPGEKEAVMTCDPWAITDSVPWLTPAWENGKTKIWRVSHA